MNESRTLSTHTIESETNTQVCCAELYLLLITNKSSNIMEDLGTLRLSCLFTHTLTSHELDLHTHEGVTN